MAKYSIGAIIWAYRSTIIMIATPLLLSPIPIYFNVAEPTYWREANCAYILAIMAVFWMTEVIPLAATALFPVVFMPIFSVSTSARVCSQYLKDTNMLFVGGLMVAVAIEKWNLHRRIALGVLMIVGTTPRWLMLGFMLPTWFLSMWISNTATAAMMVPIVQAVLMQLRETTAEDTEEKEHRSSGYDNPAMEYDNGQAVTTFTEPDESKENNGEITPSPSVGGSTNHIEGNKVSGSKATLVSDESDEPEDPAYSKLCKGMYLCIAYAASIGGIATLTGTPPNLVMKGQIDILFEKYNDNTNTKVTFGSWMVFALPISVICLVIAWLWLQLLFLCRIGGCKRQSRDKSYEMGTGDTPQKADEKDQQKRVKSVIRKEWQKMGRLTLAELILLIMFVILAALWLSRAPGQVDGWGSLFKAKYVSDATPAILVALLLFMLPAKGLWCFSGKKDQKKPGPSPALLDWKTVEKNFPWGVVILLGGGFALADSAQQSGLSNLVGKAFEGFGDINPAAMAFVIAAVIAGATEVTSNTATATLLIPIIGDLAIAIGVHPLYLILPTTLATSFAFMLPVATPPNAIVFAYGALRVVDMVLAGIGMNIICLGVVALALNTWGTAWFQLDVLPAFMQNATIISTTTILPNTTVAPLLNCTCP
ncbi:solute carrier family 13 member 5-like [Lingula anatina]|uniref:Solute carrier family 13 member 5-like n=1 Tax=Lingula anatina TaxID=7574 RepID=A0A1S3I7G9_LINAN|nr:solute carrier family 13 member 5-like [Lingula anatina]|eukprot:XP_013394197.1 solute carrier family 13 member 5-like [Lingula anatina]